MDQRERTAPAAAGLGARLRSRFGTGTTAGFGAVLLGLMLSYALAVSVNGRLGSSLVLAVQIGVVLMALRTAQARPGVRLLAFVAMTFAGVAAIASLASAGTTALGLAYAAGALLYMVAPFSLLRWIIRRGAVDRETLLAALGAYLMIGMFFAFVYRTFAYLGAGTFFGAQGDGSTAQTLFFSFTTLTTTGYGNLVPEGNPGQSVAVLEMLVGQLFLVTAVAKIITVWKPRGWGSEGSDDRGS